MAVVALNAFVTELTAIGERAINTVLRILRKEVEVAVFVSFSCNVEVAVLVITTVITVFTVFTVHQIHPETWNLKHQLMPLLKERTREIKLLTILQCIPRISVPFLLKVDGEGSSFGVDGDHLLSSTITFSMVEASVISPCHSALHPTRRAERRGGDGERFPCDSRRNILQKCTITCID